MKEHKFRKGGGQGFRELVAVQREELIRAIEKCHQTLWSGGRLSPPAAFGELCKLLFLKGMDERRTGQGEFYQLQRRSGEPEQSLAERVRRLYAVAQGEAPEVFTGTIQIEDAVLARVVEHLEGIHLGKTDLDTKGVAFARFMDGFFKGDFGQYFTPREIVAFAVELIDPREEETVLDPACGSGGFLLAALEHVRRRGDGESWRRFARENLFGVELNDEIARVAKMNMILHEDGHANIAGADALESFERLRQVHPRLVPGSFDVVLTNPPFGAVIKASEKGEAYLEKFELRRFAGESGARAGKARGSVKTEILFVEQVYRLLKPGTGRAAIVIPDGILTNASLQGVRGWMLEKFRVLAVISLPQHAFSHFGAGVKASVLVLRRRAEGELPDDAEGIFMAAPANIGYDAAGRKTMKDVETVVGDGVRRQVQRCDLYDVEIVHERVGEDAGDAEAWQERSRRVLPETGVLGQLRAFEREARAFFR